MKRTSHFILLGGSALSFAALSAVACSEDKHPAAQHPDAMATATATATATSTSTSTTTSTATAPPPHDAMPPPPPPHDAMPPMKDFCSLAGSIVFNKGARSVVGNDVQEQLPWLKLSDGLCAHHYAVVPIAREMRFAPGGELFVSSPTRGTVGGGSSGLGAVTIVPDDNADGYGDATIKFLPNLDTAHGILFAPGYLYYQVGTTIRRIPYKAGDRTPIAAPATAGEQMIDIQAYNSSAHWSKTIDMADDGTIYVTNGGDQSPPCVQPTPFQGGILKIDGSPGGKQVATGFRNPIHIRCQHGKNLCFATELARDSSGTLGGREKLVPVRQGDDWGHPCCATKNLPYSDLMPTPDCSKVASEDNGFVIGSTPFGFDFAPDNWPAPYAGSIMIALHGVFGSWQGARVVSIATDPKTGMPLKSSTVDTPTGAIRDLATGWDDSSNSHGRPGIATFAPDGRLFIGNDVTGEIFWVAPITTN